MGGLGGWLVAGDSRLTARGPAEVVGGKGGVGG